MISKKLIILGLVIVLVGMLWPFIEKLQLGRLPGDISIKREGFGFYFPITTCLLISGILSLLLWFFRK